MQITFNIRGKKSSAALKISHAEEIKIAAFVECNNVETPLKNMNRGAGRLFDSVYKLFTIHSLYVQI